MIALDAEEVTEAFQLLLARPRVDFTWEPDLRDQSLIWDGPRHGKPLLTTPRMGQGRFKFAVAEAYERRCAITGSKTFPSLEAAHIRPYAAGGAHAVPNGFAVANRRPPPLRPRVPQHRPGPAPAGKPATAGARLERAVEFYEREQAGFTIGIPGDPEAQPDRDALAWHVETTFRAA